MPETVDAAPLLAEFYQRMRTAAVSLATAQGKREFALALFREGAAF